ncbi:MAG TPA: hypothetical protein VNL74_03690 [Methylococcus sp.]|nr:hypothetical protein [Methylococcus sp.]
MYRWALKKTPLGTGVALLALLLAPQSLLAVPSMGRQTGLTCASCHTVYPELTPFGRQYKLRGFSMTAPQREKSILTRLPISGLLQSSITSTADTGTVGARSSDFPRNDDLILQAAGVYYGGKILGNSGALAQFSYDGIDARWLMEMFDARYASSLTPAGRELVYGLTLSNTPTLTDIYNSTPRWAFPYVESAAVQPTAAPLLDLQLAAQVGGVGAYLMWNNLVYAEAAFYKAGRRGLARALTAGAEIENVVDDFAPYWRLALQHEWDSHSLSVGTYGMVADLFPEGRTGGPSNRFRDLAFDAQYQYIGQDHIFSAQANYIHERQDWTAGFAEGEASNRSDTLQTLKANLHYYFRRTYGLGVQYFLTRGDRDKLRYDTGEPVFGSITGRPDTDGWLAELNYLPVSHLKLALRYTGYTRFNGASNDYDGFGRNAGDNNSLFFLAWLLF